MVKAYQKFEETARGGIVASAEVNTVEYLDERRVLVAVNETVVGYNVKSGDRVENLCFRPTADQKAMAESVLAVTAISVCKTLELLAVGYVDGSVRLFSLSPEEEAEAEFGFPTVVLNGHKSAVTSLCFVAGDEHLVSGSKDTDAVVWEISGRCGLHRLRGHTGPISCVASLSSELVVTAGRDSLLKLWNVQTGFCLQSVVAGSLGEEVGALLHLELGFHKLLICGSTGTRMSVYQVVQRQEAGDDANACSSSLVFARFIDREIQSGLVTRLLFLQSSASLVSICAGSRRVEVWRLRKSKKASDLAGVKMVKQPVFFAQAKVKSAAVACPGGAGAAAGVTGGRVLCLSLADNRLEFATQCSSSESVVLESVAPLVEKQGHREGVICGALTLDESMLATVDKTSALKLWSAQLQCVRTLDGGEQEDLNSKKHKISALAWVDSDRSNSHILLGTSEGKLLLVNVHSGQVLFALDLPVEGEAVTSVQFVGASEVAVVSASRVCFVSLTASGELQLQSQERMVVQEEERITCMAASESLVAVALGNNTVQLHYRDTLKPSLLLYGHSLPVLAMDFLEGDLLATLSADKTLKIFSTKFGNIAKSLRLSFAPTSLARVKGSHLAFVAGEGHLEQHDLDLTAGETLVWEMRNLHVGPNRVILSRADAGVLVSLGSQDRGVVRFARTETQWFQDDLVESREQKSIDSELANVQSAASVHAVAFDRPTRKSHETVRRTEKLQELLLEAHDSADKIGRLLCKIPSADLQEVLLGLSIAEGRKLLEGLLKFLDKVQHTTLFPIDVLLNVGLTLVQVQGRYLIAEPDAEILLQHFHATLAKILLRRKKESRKALAGAEIVAGQISRLA